MKQPIRVLHIFTILNRGGAESMLMNYYRNIDRDKVQFDFLVHREEIGEFEEEIIKLGGHIYRLPPINPMSPKAYYEALDDFLNVHPYRIIHSHINTFSFYPLKLANEKGVPVRIAHAHTTSRSLTLIFVLKRPTEAAKHLFKSVSKSGVKKQATHLFSCGKKAGEWLFGKKPYQLVPNAIDLSKYLYNSEIDLAIRDALGLQNQLVVGHIGNFTYPKNYPFPLVEGEKFCAEGLVWNRIALKYKLMWFSKIIYICEYLEGGLTDNSFKIRKNSPITTTNYYSELAKMDIPFLQKIKANINYWRFVRFLEIPFMEKWKRMNPVLNLIGFPISLILQFKDKT